MQDAKHSRKWRLLAITTLALICLAGLISILVVLRNPLWSILFIATAALAAAVAWRWFFAKTSGRAWLYISSLVLLLVALLAELIMLLRDKQNVRAIFLILVIATASMGLAKLLRSHYISKLQPIGSLSTAGAPYLVINPLSGSGRAIKANIPELAAKMGIKVLQMKPGGDLVELLEQAASQGATVLGISGGDGSIGAAADMAARHGIPLVVLPGGTRCHFAKDIGLDPNNMADALRCFGGPEVKIDAARINDRVFVNNASFGIYAHIVSEPGYREHKLKAAGKVFEAVAASGKGFPLSFVNGEGEARREAVIVLVGVNRYQTLNVAEPGVRKRLDEGVLQITALYQVEKSLVKQMKGAIKLNSRDNKELEQWEGQEFSISGTDAVIAAGVDGELVELSSPVHIKVMPGWLRLQVLPEGLQARRDKKAILSNLENYALKGTLPGD
jgi:diacylglycerol kinase family enzyme